MCVYQGAWLGSEASEKKRVSRRKYMQFFYFIFSYKKKYMQFIISTIPGWDGGEELLSTKIPVSDLKFILNYKNLYN